MNLPSQRSWGYAETLNTSALLSQMFLRYIILFKRLKTTKGGNTCAITLHLPIYRVKWRGLLLKTFQGKTSTLQLIIVSIYMITSSLECMAAPTVSAAPFLDIKCARTNNGDPSAHSTKCIRPAYTAKLKDILCSQVSSEFSSPDYLSCLSAQKSGKIVFISKSLFQFKCCLDFMMPSCEQLT